MKTAEIKTSSTAQNQIQAKRQPFFSKEGQDSFFSKSSEATSSFFSPTTIQPKLTIGQPNDKYEVEADAMADNVVQKSGDGSLAGDSDFLGVEGSIGSRVSHVSLLQTKCDTCEEEEEVYEEKVKMPEIQKKPIFENQSQDNLLQTKPESTSTPKTNSSFFNEEILQKKEDEEILENMLDAKDKFSFEEDTETTKDKGTVQKKPENIPTTGTPFIENRLTASKGSGSSLSSEMEDTMGGALGADFSNVRVHTGNDAVQMTSQLGAQAFTHGNDIYFNKGKYDTNSKGGKHLLAHELTHTIQQGSSIQTKKNGAQKKQFNSHNSPNVQASWYNFSIPFTDYQFDPSIEGIKTAGNLVADTAVEGAAWVKDKVFEGFEWVYDQIAELVSSGLDWLTDKFNDIKEFATSSFEDIKSNLGNVLALITSPMALINQAFAIMDAGLLSTAWKALSTGANIVWIIQKGLINGLLSIGNGIWNTVSSYVSTLFSSVGSLMNGRFFRLLPSSLQNAARRFFNTISSLWRSIRDFWDKFWNRLRTFVKDLLTSIENFVKKISSFAINGVISVVTKLKEAYDFVQILAKDPEGVIRPVIDQVANKIYSEAPEKSREVLQEKMLEATSKSQDRGGVGGVIQRKPERTTTSRDEVNAALDRTLEEQLAKLDIRKLLWDTFVNLFWPPATIRAIGHEFYELWTTDWANTVESLFSPRNIFDDFGGFFHDLWSNILILLDFPLALWRRLNAILMLLMVYVTAILVLVGFIGGGIAGGGAFSVPAAFAGAVAGFKLALVIGEGLFISFIMAEGISILKAFLDLYTARQTEDEKKRDYAQIVGGSIGIGIAIVIVLVFALLGAFVKAVVAKIRRVRASNKPTETTETTESTETTETGEGETRTETSEETKPETSEETKPDSAEETTPERAEETTPESTEETRSEPVEEAREPIEEVRVERRPCFVSGTKIDTTQGPVPIEIIKVKDVVLTKHMCSDDTPKPYRVTNIKSGGSWTLCKIYVAGASIVCTPNHFFATINRGWVPAKELNEQDELETTNGSVRPTLVLRGIPVKEEIVYNFTVEHIHTYFVVIGEHSILVHNDKPYFDSEILWFYDDKMQARNTDVDGKSVWETNNRPQAEEWWNVRIHEQSRSTKSRHSWMRTSQFAEFELIAVETPGTGPHAEAGFKHYSIRPIESPNPSVDLSEAEINTLNERLAEMKAKYGAAQRIKAKAFEGC